VAGAGVGTHAFWRSVEGVETLTTRTERAEAGAKVAASDRSSQPDAVWMVSQACPIRRARFATLWLAAPAGVSSQWLSGGFTSEVEVSGEMVFASQYGQEQWLSRNVQAGQLTASERSHNIVFANSAAKSADRKQPPRTYLSSVNATLPIVRKPYLRADDKGHVAIRVPPVEAATRGWSLQAEEATDEGSHSHALSRECVAGQDKASNATTSTAELQAMLGRCTVVLLLPAIYPINATLKVDANSAPSLVAILGVGLATLRLMVPQPALQIASTRLRLSGVMIDVSFPGSKAQTNLSIVDWQRASTLTSEGAAKQPGASIHDLFVRTWRDPRIANQWVPSAYRSMLRVRQPGLIIDHVWLWMADHDCVGYPAPSSVEHGLEVEAADVIAYALQVEHQIKELVLWSGEGGTTVMLQTEAAYTGAANPGCYTVTAATHTGYGIGSYGVTSRGHVATRLPPASAFRGTFHNLLSMSINGPQLIPHIVCFGNGTSAQCQGVAQAPGKSYHSLRCPPSATTSGACSFVINHD